MTLVMFALVLAIILWSSVTHGNALENATECPIDCSCDFTFFFTQLTVDCRNHSHADVEKFIRQLALFLSGSDVVQHVTSLWMSNTPLTRVPASVCQLQKLSTLHLDDNKLVQLPDNCFNKLTKLRTLSATRNSIVSLQNAVFDGLPSLKHLDLSYNNISHIGLRVFSNVSELTRLRWLGLSHNKLTSLEPWWYYRCILGNEKSLVNIELRFNMISNFTNELQFHYHCGMKRPYGHLHLFKNQITHIMDILRGWDISTDATLICLHNVRKNSGLMDFDFGGRTYVCDCIDCEIYKLARMLPMSSTNILNNVLCRTDSFSTALGQSRLAATIPLNEFVCELGLSNRCPPGCRCAYRPANTTLHVYCSSANLSSLPRDLPPLPKSYDKYHLDFSNNKLLGHLEHRSYFVNTSILDVSNCGLTEITTAVLMNVSLFKAVNFGGNMIQSFPRQASSVNISARLLLGHNPWRCSCDNSWMISWLQSLQILDPGKVTCRSPSRMYDRNVLKATEEDFCVDPVTRMLKISSSSTLSAVIALLLFGFAIYRLRVQLYSRWKFHPFDRDECCGEEMDYDVFFCCSDQDHCTHAHRIIRMIESKGFSVCDYERDIPSGFIWENISRAITRSKRTVCLISNNFLQSSKFMTVFQMAYHHNVVVKHKKRLIVLMALERPAELDVNDASYTAALRLYLRQYTYVDYTTDGWPDRLLYALPLRGMLQNNDDRLVADDDNVQIAGNNETQEINAIHDL